MKTLYKTRKPKLMKNLLYTTLMIMMTCFDAMAQSPTENYIKTTTYTAPSTGVITENDTIVSVTYFDGLGRPKQTIAVKGGGQGQDIITPIVYDNYGRQVKAYLPYAAVTQNGNIHPDPITELEAFYDVKYPNTPNPYSENVLENSPLNRVMEQGAPGVAWLVDPMSDTDHTVKFNYGLNIASDEVQLYKVSLDSNYITTLENPGIYGPATLYKTITKDENWQPGDENLHTTVEFTDQQGQIVLKRTYADMPLESQVTHDTYYVYDDFGNLTYVIPPKVDTSEGISQEELGELCYQYRYDYKNRLVEKKLPGKGKEFIVYDKLDQPVFTQDHNLKVNNQWFFTKYDKFGRVAYTGIFSSSDSRDVLQTTMNGITDMYDTRTGIPTVIDGTDVYYDNTAFPTSNIEVLTINYYDNYIFNLDGAVEEDAYGVTPTTETQGLFTGSKTRVLGTDQWITNVTWYDEKARPIYSYTKNNYLNSIDKLKSKLDFTGKVLETNAVHTKDEEADIITIEKFTYDAMGRLLKQTHQIAGHPEETLAENVYDELGQLIQKKVGNNPAMPLQTLDYSYNIQGWLTKINDVDNIGNDLFSFTIHYNDPTNSTPLYNSNISQTLWRTNNIDASLKGYSYSYDALNRITEAIDNTGNYNLNSISYDKNGNIVTLSRQGHTNDAADTFGVMDDLAYTYDSGNKLLRVEDTGNDTYGFKDDAVAVADIDDDYSYDVNGNLISDTNKGITSIVYNHLNMPIEVTFNNDPNQKISYLYTPDGVKQQKIVNDGGVITTTDYAGSYIYENSSLKFINHSGGYIGPDGSNYQYIYQLKDIWGNTRITYADDNANGFIEGSEIRREQNYYPFGLQHEGYNSVVQNVRNNLKTYQGQEFTEDLELNTHEWKYRISDPTIGRFWQIDPLAEDYTYNSTYAFQENKMGLGIELEGLEVQYLNPSKLFNYEGGGKPVLTLGLHNIVAPTFERSSKKGLGALAGNLLKAAWNGVASTWNDGMNGKNSGEISSEGMAQMGDMARRIERGEGTIEDVENITAAVVMTAVKGKVGAKKGKTPSVKEQAQAIKKDLNGGKNSVTVKTSDGHIRYDLEGKDHGGVETPHKQSYQKNYVNGEVKSVTRKSKKAEAMTQQDIRTVRKTLEKRKENESQE